MTLADRCSHSPLREAGVKARLKTPSAHSCPRGEGGTASQTVPCTKADPKDGQTQSACCCGEREEATPEKLLPLFPRAASPGDSAQASDQTPLLGISHQQRR